MNIKETIRNICKSHNTSIPKLEAALGFGGGTIGKWDKSAPSIDKLLKVSEYFHVPIDYLIGIDTKFKPQPAISPEQARLLHLSEKLTDEQLNKLIDLVECMQVNNKP